MRGTLVAVRHGELLFAGPLARKPDGPLPERTMFRNIVRGRKQKHKHAYITRVYAREDPHRLTYNVDVLSLRKPEASRSQAIGTLNKTHLRGDGLATVPPPPHVPPFAQVPPPSAGIPSPLQCTNLQYFIASEVPASIRRLNSRST
ncbi:unnamed protein product [Ectocarpus fasciculatus]